MSKTISRMLRLLIRFAARTQDGQRVAPRKVRSLRRDGERPQDRVDLALGGCEPAPGIDEEMRAAALLRVGHLAGEQRVELLLRHARPGEHARALHLWRGGHDDDDVDALRLRRSRRGAARRPATRRRPAARAFARNASSLARTSGCTIASSRASAAGSPTTRSASTRAIDRAVGGHAGKRRLDRRDGRAAIEPMHGRVGVVHRNAARARTSRPSCSFPCRSSR